MRCHWHAILLACAAVIIAGIPAPAAKLIELPPSAVPQPALALLSLDAAWAKAGLPEMNSFQRRVRVFGYSGKRPFAMEGYATLSAQAVNQCLPSVELTVWFARRSKLAPPLPARFDAKVVEMNREFARSSGKPATGVTELRDDAVPILKMPYMRQIALLTRTGPELECLDSNIAVYLALGKYDYLLELNVQGLDAASYEILRRALADTVLEAASL
jgi:hypothetical protein